MMVNFKEFAEAYPNCPWARPGKVSRSAHLLAEARKRHPEWTVKKLAIPLDNPKPESAE